jgi:hypothetical protein
MKTSRFRLIGATALVAVTIGWVQQAGATEAAAGRYIPGAFAGPGLGIVPPPGAYWALENVYYSGKAAGDVPYSGDLVAAGMASDMWTTALAGVYVPDGVHLPGKWTYAVQGALPVGWTGTTATADIAPFQIDEEVTGLGDIAVTPVLLGWHNKAMDTFVSTSFTVTAPTGWWEKGSLVFVGLNYWTFTPAIAYTHLWHEQGIDFSADLGIDINTKNTAVDYYSGAMAHLDLSLTKDVTENLTIGAIGGILYQVQDDQSTFADTHNGFKGRSVALGPLIQYAAKFGENTEIDLTFKWSHELAVKNRMKGNALVFQLSGKF